MSHHKLHPTRVPSMPGSFGVERPVQRATTQAELGAMQAPLQGNPAHARMSRAMTRPRLRVSQQQQLNPQTPQRAMPQRQGASPGQRLQASTSPGSVYVIAGNGNSGQLVVGVAQFGHAPAKMPVQFQRLGGGKVRITAPTTGPAKAWIGKIVPVKMQGNPGHPQPTLAGTFANSQMPVAASSQHRGVNIKAQGIAQDEAEAIARRGNPRLPSMPGTFANSQLPVAAPAMHQGANIQAQAQAQAAAVHATHSDSMQRSSNPGCASCADAGKSARGAHAMLMSRRMPMGPNPTTRVPSLPGAYGLPMLGLGDRRGMPAMQGNPRTMWDQGNGFSPQARFRIALNQAARQRYAANPEGGFGPLKRFQIGLERAANPKHKAIHTAKARMRKQANPGCGGSTPIKCKDGTCVSSVTLCASTSLAAAPTFQGKLARQARMARSVRRGRAAAQKGGQSGSKKAPTLLQSCPPGYYFAFGYGCLPIPKKGNPAPSRASKGTSDVTYGVYHPTSGAEQFIPDANAAKTRAKELSSQHGNVQVKIGEYRGDGQGGWVSGNVFSTRADNPSISARTRAKVHRDIARARAGNPGCSSCMGKMKFMPKVG